MRKLVKAWFCVAGLICGIPGISIGDPGDCVQYIVYDDGSAVVLYLADHHEEQSENDCDPPTENYVWASNLLVTPEPCGNCSPKEIVNSKSKGKGKTSPTEKDRGECKGLNNKLDLKHIFKSKFRLDQAKGGGGQWHPRNGVAVLATKWIFVTDENGNDLPFKLFKYQMDYVAAGLTIEESPGKKRFGPEQWIGYEMKKMPKYAEEEAPVLDALKLDATCQFMAKVVIDESRTPVIVVSWQNHPLFNE